MKRNLSIPEDVQAKLNCIWGWTGPDVTEEQLQRIATAFQDRDISYNDIVQWYRTKSKSNHVESDSDSDCEEYI
jgi:hypothetical protein